MRFSKLYIYIAAILSGVAIGAAATFLITPNESVESWTTPEILKSSEESDSFPISIQEFDDEVLVEFRLSVNEPTPVRVQQAGVVTRWNCVVGEEISSGKSQVDIDGESVLSIAAKVPFWRDIQVGDTGDDVEALKEELRRLGYPATKGKELSGQDIEYLTKLAGRSSLAAESFINREDLIWLPVRRDVVQSCDATIGEDVVPGDVLATVGTGYTIHKIQIPSGAVSGDRTVEIGDSLVPISASGKIKGNFSMVQLQSSDEYQESRSSDPEATEFTLHLTSKLIDPISVAAVPATAIIVGQDGKKCVVSDEKRMNVEVVGSQLGNSYVTFDEKVPEAISLEGDEMYHSCA